MPRQKVAAKRFEEEEEHDNEAEYMPKRGKATPVKARVPKESSN
jgi:hypothetical protein